MKCDENIKLVRYLCIYRAVVVGRFTGQGGICGCYIRNRRGRGRGFNFDMGVDRLKGRLGKVDGLSSELANLSGVSISELLKWEIVLH